MDKKAPHIFILDDDMDVRLPIILNLLKSNGVKAYELFKAKNFDDAMVLFKNKKSYDIGFFDRDLSTDPISGEDVARFVLDNSIKFGQVIVHSGNPIGAEKIYRIFENADYSVIKIPITSMSDVKPDPDEVYSVEG